MPECVIDRFNKSPVWLGLGFENLAGIKSENLNA